MAVLEPPIHAPFQRGNQISREWNEYFRNIRQSLNPPSSPTFVGLTLTGLTADRLIYANSAKELTSVSSLADWLNGVSNKITVSDDGDGTVTISISNNYLPNNVLGEDGEITITDNGNGTVTIGASGSFLPNSIIGTTNQLIVTDNEDGTVTLSTPQDIHAAANPTFNNLTLTGNLLLPDGGYAHATEGPFLTFTADSSSPNKHATFRIIPEGTGILRAKTEYYANENYASNYEKLEIGTNLIENNVQGINSTSNGTGTTRPVVFYFDGTEKARLTPDGTLKTAGGRIVNTTRFTSGPQTLDATHCVVFCDTDGGDITLNLSAGVAGTYYRVINCGSSANDVILTPDGTEQIRGNGAGVALTIEDGVIVEIIYDTTEDWW